MTTYSYSVILNDSDVIAVEAALRMYIKYCDEQLRNGPRAPFIAHRLHAEQILSRLSSNATMTSTSSFISRRDPQDDSEGE